ncbi:hypothetical protein ACFCV9_00835 [Streptomyces sp. NPDC056367]|uniref:hypothetical protein n=1 Tax=Streptomyces sp. NPDC056367 TaxID=3345797 RepID=UPI0035D96295
MVKAVLLARKNEQRFKELKQRRKKLERHIRQETEEQDRRRRAVYDKALVPFQEVFTRLKHVDLAELAPVDPSGSEVADVKLRELQHVAATAAASLGPRTHTRATVLPALDPVREQLTGTDPARALASLATLTSGHAGIPLHLTPEEFDSWMTDTETDGMPLVLDPNW